MCFSLLPIQMGIHRFSQNMTIYSFSSLHVLVFSVVPYLFWKFVLSGLPQMWPDLIQKAKEGGLDVVETYVFWNGHEPEPGKVMEDYIFTQISPCSYPFSM